MKYLEPHTINVTEKFCNYAKAHVQRLGWKPINGDSLLFEWYLITNKMVQKPLNWRHDFIDGDKFIDVKEIRSKWFNIDRLRGPQTKMAQLRESITSGNLTHFLFYHTDKNHGRLLVPGDVVNITPICLAKARNVVKSATKSTPDKDTEAFVPLETLKVIGETLEQVS